MNERRIANDCAASGGNTKAERRYSFVCVRARARMRKNTRARRDKICVSDVSPPPSPRCVGRANGRRQRRRSPRTAHVARDARNFDTCALFVFRAASCLVSSVAGGRRLQEPERARAHTHPLALVSAYNRSNAKTPRRRETRYETTRDVTRFSPAVCLPAGGDAHSSSI